MYGMLCQTSIHLIIKCIILLIAFEKENLAKTYLILNFILQSINVYLINYNVHIFKYLVTFYGFNGIGVY